jgi:hypothetical protein
MPRRFAFSLLLGLVGLAAASAGCDESRQGGHLVTQPSPVLGVTAVSPNAGAMLGATPLTIVGSGFKAGATVQFGGVPAPVSAVSSTSISATAPAHTDGAVTVVVTNSDGQSASLASGYTYELDSAFAISGVVTEMTDEGEMPVEGVRITASGTSTSVQTDATGAYRLGGLRRSTLDVTAFATGYVVVTKSVTTRSDFQADFRLARSGFVLSGLVYETTPNGRVPLEGVVLYCDGCGSPFGHTFVTTDTNGLYRFAWTNNGKNWIQFVRKDGYRYAGPSEPFGIPVNVNGDTRFDIELVKR